MLFLDSLELEVVSIETAMKFDHPWTNIEVTEILPTVQDKVTFELGNNADVTGFIVDWSRFMASKYFHDDFDSLNKVVLKDIRDRKPKLSEEER